MRKSSIKKAVFTLALFCLGFSQAGLAAETAISTSDIKTDPSAVVYSFPGKLDLAKGQAPVREAIPFKASQLKPNQPVRLSWQTVEGSYEIANLYEMIGTRFEKKEIDLSTGQANGNGEWEGTFHVPEGFGGDHTISVWQGEQKMTQANFYVEPTFSISPTSGPIGTEITIIAEGIGSKKMESNWQLTYDNKLTGLISATSTNGKAVAKIRAAGPVGKHTLTIWHGYMGLPYLNHQQAPTAYLPVPSFTFEVTEDKPVEQKVEKTPLSAANGGVQMPALVNQPGVSVSLNKTEGIVGEQVTLQATGLPANQTIDLIWNTMEGSRVSGKGFGEKTSTLSQVKTDDKGNIKVDFAIPNDLGGLPHRIDLKAQDQVYGQAYLRILPSIVQVTPSSGPVGTEITIEINGVGWTEYDNTYNVTYDNAYVGYACGFNSHGNVKFTLIAAGEPGYHLIDLYPGIYKGKEPLPNIYNAPLLTYEQDHPGTAIPAIRLGFQVTE